MRLVRKDKRFKDGYFIPGYYCIYEKDVFNKLGQLEDIEEELGIDLITLFKARNGFYSKYFDNFVKPKNIVCFEEGTRPYMEVIVNNKIKLIFIDDYGKTWALTKEELL